MLTCQRSLFRLPEEVSYLNCAYMSPLLRSVEAMGCEMVRRKSLPYEIQGDDFFEPVRELKTAFARLVNALNPDRVALIPSVSYGMATVARNLSLAPGDNVVLVAEQFPSNYYPWQRLAAERGAELRVIGPPDAQDRTAGWNEALLSAIDERTALLAVSHVHWADGTVFDLKALRQKTLEAGALMVIDGTQSVGALPFDVQALRPDALVCAGYKWLLGPYSIGVAYYGPAFDGGVPIEENWINRRDSEDFKNLVHYQPEYQPLAGRYSVGEQSNFILVPMLRRALEQILDWGPVNVQRYLREIAGEPLAQLRDLGCRLEGEDSRAHHLFGIRLDDHFDTEKLHAAMLREQVYVSYRGSAVRVAPHVYNDRQDFERLVSCFAEARKAAIH